MTAQDNDYRRRMEASPHPDGGREPTLDVPPLSDKAEADEPVTPSGPAREAAPAAPQASNAGLEKARAEAADYKDKALRAVAELENYRRRAEKEREDVSKYAISNFAREMLPVADNLRRALDAQPAAEGEVAAPLKAFIAGVELTERELLAAFERFGLKKIDPMGQPFDHNYHQAMFELDDPSHPAGTIVQVMQSGYLLKDRLLRPALVGVSKGGPARAVNTDAYTTSNDGEHSVDTKA